MLIGEAPGKQEDRWGKPFVGKSGKELDNYLDRFAHISRKACYVTNVVLCRPDAKDRDPRPEEIRVCTTNYLIPDLVEIAPKYIICAGVHAAGFVLGETVKMEMVHGIGYRWEGFGINSTVIPVYHPSYGLHLTRKMRFIQEDFEMVGEIVRGRGDVRMWAPGMAEGEGEVEGEVEGEEGGEDGSSEME